MTDSQSPESDKRKPYSRPAVERVVLDPIKEMLDACPTNIGGKVGGSCTQNFS
jgi:hypothetical protein